MSDMRNEKLSDYYDAAESWADDRGQASDRSRRIAWGLAAAATLVAILEAIALVMLIPLKREVPYTLLVDRQTGYVEALKPLDQQVVSPDAALTRSFLVQYVIARESFDRSTLQANYRKVGLWSAGEARQSYLELMKPSNPIGPFAALPSAASVEVRVRSVSSLSAGRSMVRFDTIRSDRGSSSQQVESWAAVIDYGFSSASMSAEDRIENPLGFQVQRYRKDAETLPVVEEYRELPAGPKAPAEAQAGADQ